MDIPSTSLHCNSMMESRQHLFFDCSFISEVWSFFTSRAHLSPPTSFDDSLRWMKDPSRTTNISLILRLIYQAAIYAIWRERNSKLHNASFRLPLAIIKDIQLTICSCLDPLSRAQRTIPQRSLISLIGSGFFRV
ncbi:hypothetical protein V5N11_017098 [Cardamine amara subsp. amara]|uniref:Reverse transcriptase zinc-binding domain-containing protein n=1 Tax=Cardamine amara subsp. amara TaxID=228776 RepID=A0ABD0ZF16_CARAN